MEFNKQQLEPQAGESVLDLLLRHNQQISYSCKSGNCQSCLVKSLQGDIEPTAQRGLKSTLISQGCFMACQQAAENIAHCCPIDKQVLFGSARLIEKHFFNDDICRLKLELSCALYYHAGQFINLKNIHGVSRSYSLASLPSQDTFLELHVRRKDGGEMSNWIFNEFQAGDYIDVQGPIGECFYVTDNLSMDLILIGTGTGAAPLIGIARDAIQSGHLGDIHFYHGASHVKDLYLDESLSDLQNSVTNFYYHPCISSSMPLSSSSLEEKNKKYKNGLCNLIALDDIKDAKNSRLYICGNPQMVLSTSKKAFLNGVSISNIYSDPFEYKDMRKIAR